MDNIKDFWQQVLDIVEVELEGVSELGFSTWVKTITPISFENNLLTLQVPLSLNKEIIEKRYLTLIQSAVDFINKNKTEIYIEVENEKNEDVLENPALHNNENDAAFKTSNLNYKYTFDNFVVGDSNTFACAAAQAVANNPGKNYNPLFLYGDVGLGKTHLMQAIGNTIYNNNKESKILYTTSEIFMNELINSIKDGTNKDFKNKYRNVDVLMIDDIQFLGGKDSTQDEFFHTFNYLHQANKQIIISSDRPPKDISRLEERLRSRFEWGLICDIKRPNFETRLAILKKKVKSDNIDISDEMLEFIAERIKSNIRELEGVLNRISAYSHLTNQKITKDMVIDVVNEISSQKKNKAMNIDTIIYEIAKYYDIDAKLLQSATRKTPINEIRQIGMYVLRELTDISLKKIGENFGGRDHSTVLNSINNVTAKMNEDEAYKDKVNNLIKNLQGMM